MKKLLMLAILVSGNLMAGERVLLKDSKEMIVPINTTSVRCSSIGYSVAELKVNIKGLDGWTIFDHTNVRAGDFLNLPCMTAGQCRYTTDGEGHSIDEIIQNNPRTEKVVVQRELIETRTLTKNENGSDICERMLTEKLNAIVGGVPFFHQRSGAVEEFPAKACN